ncbi:MAG: hypothetical protein HYS06_00860 [Methylocystis sp.]|nr:hypothetical protein [Methylocystis sp.]
MTTGAGIVFRKRLAAVSMLGLLLGPGVASAQSCQDDLQKLSQRRMGQIAALNQLGKAGKGKMDPGGACSMGRRLVAIETEMLSYMEKNKDWCAIPDATVDGFKEARAKTEGFAAKACAAVAQAKKMQEESQRGATAGQTPAQKLPAGPL